MFKYMFILFITVILLCHLAKWAFYFNWDSYLGFEKERHHQELIDKYLETEIQVNERILSHD